MIITTACNLASLDGVKDVLTFSGRPVPNQTLYFEVGWKGSEPIIRESHSLKGATPEAYLGCLRKVVASMRREVGYLDKWIAQATKDELHGVSRVVAPSASGGSCVSTVSTNTNTPQASGVSETSRLIHAGA